MFVKVTTSGPRRYVQLVESYRDDAGRVKKRTVATLGRLDQLTGELDSVIDGLLKVAGREPVIALSTATPVGAAAGVSFESARALGNVWTLTEIWKELGFSDLRRVWWSSNFGHINRMGELPIYARKRWVTITPVWNAVVCCCKS